MKTFKIVFNENFCNQGETHDRINRKKNQISEKILDSMTVRLMYVDSKGVLEYVNVKSITPPSSPKEIGSNIADCHNEKSTVIIAHIFDQFKKGRTEPHHYVNRRRGIDELVTLIPFFEDGVFVGCLSQIHALGLNGPEKSYAEADHGNVSEPF